MRRAVLGGRQAEVRAKRCGCAVSKTPSDQRLRHDGSLRCRLSRQLRERQYGTRQRQRRHEDVDRLGHAAVRSARALVLGRAERSGASLCSYAWPEETAEERDEQQQHAAKSGKCLRPREDDRCTQTGLGCDVHAYGAS